MKKNHLLPRCAAMLALLGSSNVVHAGDVLFQSLIDVKSPTAMNMVQSSNANAGVWRYQINANALRADTHDLTLAIKPGLTVTAHVGKTQQTENGGLLWQGSIDRSSANIGKRLQEIDALPDSNDVTLVRRGMQISGSLRIDGHLYRVQPLLKGQHVVIEVDESKLIDHPREYDQLASAPASLQRANFVPAQAASATADAPVIRVLVAYTAAAATASGNIQNLIDVAVAETNQGYGNSGINAVIQLAGTTQVTYTESGSVDTDKNRFAGTSDGYMDNIHALRDSTQADIAVLITSKGDACGIAAAIGAQASSAFAVVTYDCATGYYSFGHEMGHLQSARHDPANDPTNTPYAYGHGFQAADKSFRTVMAYNCSGAGCPRVKYWSNPAVTYSNGLAMGTTASNNNARVLNNTANTVSQFRGPIVENSIPETESNNTAATANVVVSSGITVNGNMGSSTDTDYFKVNLAAGKTLTATLTPGTSADYDLYIYSDNGTTQLTASEKGTGLVDTASVTNSSGALVVRYVRVKYYSGGTGSTNGKYTLKLNW